MLRHRAPPAALRLHRFSRGGAPRWKRHLPLALPLVVGFGVAVVVDAALPKAGAEDDVAAVVVDAASNDADSDAVAPARPTLTLPPLVLSTTQTTQTSATTETTETTTTATAPKRPTRDPRLESRIGALLEQGKTPYSAVVVLEAQTGRVLALSEHSTRGAPAGLPLRPMAPAASVFKIVTSSALLEQGVSPSERVCFHGGKTRMQPSQLNDTKRDGTCITFDDVVPHSANVALAKLASRHLTPDLLRAQAKKWGFGGHTSVVDGEIASTAVIPDAGFDFAETAAGFGDVQISALQGAAIASIVANDGILIPANDDKNAEVEPRRVVSAQTAKQLKAMMTSTVTEGTGKAFRQSPRLPISAAGKTGSLTDYHTGLDTSWFVGFAPAEAPVLVVAAVVVNTSKWHIKAPWLAKESLRLALDDHGPPKPTARVAAR